MTTDGVLVLSGPPCGGKSTVGRLLATEAAASDRRRIYLEVDALFSILLPASDRGRADRMLAYDAAHHLARMLLERGSGVILECTYARREQRLSLVQALSDLPGVPLRVVELEVSPDEAVRRFRRRRQDTDLDADLLRERVEAFPYSERALRLSASEVGGEELARRIDEWLAQDPPPIQREAWVESGRGWD